jgi:hypothetical protein
LLQLLEQFKNPVMTLPGSKPMPPNEKLLPSVRVPCLLRVTCPAVRSPRWRLTHARFRQPARPSGRLFALALNAREENKFLLSDEITKLAIEASDQADEMDQREVQHQQPAHEPEQHQPAQQQQQPQLSSDKETDKPPGTESA